MFLILESFSFDIATSRDIERHRDIETFQHIFSDRRVNKTAKAARESKSRTPDRIRNHFDTTDSQKEAEFHRFRNAV